MGFGSKPKKAKIPPATPIAALPPPPPVPELLDEDVIQKERARRRQKLAARGRAGTILTEGGLGSAQTGKATLLGGAL